jgi:pimeloyl-ACP methyl ester carboxylesterase
MRDRKDRVEILRNFKGPKLLIAGTEDGAVKIEASRAQQDAFSHYIELHGVGHMGMVEEREKTVEVVREFCLRSL